VNLFVYGTLRDAGRVRRLTGRDFVGEPAVLRGYRRCEPPGSHAYITPDPSGEVCGQILRDVDAAAVQAFDAYEDEGRLYRRVAVRVTVAGRDEPAEAYVGWAPVPRTESEQP
jgi:gamma-glutamylcyclotransferase (GGCT)/AIG2-like uncharacterized protein YtfP